MADIPAWANGIVYVVAHTWGVMVAVLACIAYLFDGWRCGKCGDKKGDGDCG